MFVLFLDATYELSLIIIFRILRETQIRILYESSLIGRFGGFMTISEETRERVVQAYLSGKDSMLFIAEMFDVSFPSVIKWVSIF